VYGWA